MSEQISQDFYVLRQQLIVHLKLKGLRPKTIDSYLRAVDCIGHYFNFKVNDLSKDQLLEYFNQVLEQRSWSTVKHRIYGLSFFFQYVLNRPWDFIKLVKPPKSVIIPDILTIDEVILLIQSTRYLSYRVFFFVVYSLGLRISEGVNLKLGDIDASRMTVHIRHGKGNRDRMLPLPMKTLTVVKSFCDLHGHAELVFPSRKRGLNGAFMAESAMDISGIQKAMKVVVTELGLKKRSRFTA